MTTTERAVLSEVRTGGGGRAFDAAIVMAAVAGMATAAAAAARTDLSGATDLGLVGAMPGTFWMGLAVVATAFAACLARSTTPDWLYAAVVVSLVTPLFGLTSFASDIPRGSVAWRHAGIVENLSRTGSPDPLIDAYFNWPGFFALGSLLSETTGISPLGLTLWAPLYVNLLMLPVLVLLMRRFTAYRAQQWTAIWLFYLFQWVGQDYFAPQSYTYLLYLLVITCVLYLVEPRSGQVAVRWLQLDRLLRGAGSLVSRRRPTGARLGAFFVVTVVLAVATVSSHQLTPFALMLALTALALLYGRTPAVAAVVLAIAIATWLPFMASSYLEGHLVGMISDVGVDGAVQTNLGERLGGSPGHEAVVRIRLLVTAGLMALAGIGVARRWQAGLRDTTPVALAACSFLLVPLQSYGGEMLLRSYFFALPFFAFLATYVLDCWSQRRSALLLRCVAVLAVTLMLLPVFVVTRYGNARAEQYTSTEVATVAAMYEAAAPGTHLFAAASSVPWEVVEYEQHKTTVLSSWWRESPSAQQVAGRVQATAEHEVAGAYLVVSDRQIAYLELFGGMPPQAVDDIADILVDRYGWVTIHATVDARVLASPTGASDG